MKRHDARVLAEVIEESVKTRGVTPQAVWLDKQDTLDKGVKRCEAILRMVGSRKAFSVLDVGCGPGFAVGFLEDRYEAHLIRYCGVDVSSMLISAAQKLWPHRQFINRDIIVEPLGQEAYEFTAINGVLTAKYSLSHQEMESFAFDLLEAAWKSTAIALSFNVMSPYVDWTRDDLFHWPMDHAAAFCTSRLSRHINIIADYGLYEYTVQVFREPMQQGAVPAIWRR